jgi:hypothetical protein
VEVHAVRGSIPSQFLSSLSPRHQAVDTGTSVRSDKLTSEIEVALYDKNHNGRFDPLDLLFEYIHPDPPRPSDPPSPAQAEKALARYEEIKKKTAPEKEAAEETKSPAVHVDDLV